MKDCNIFENPNKELEYTSEKQSKNREIYSFELRQQCEEDFPQKSDNDGDPNNEIKRTGKESEEDWEENIVEHLHLNVDSGCNETYF